MHLIKFSMLPSKIGCILYSQLFYHMHVKFQISRIVEIIKNVHHMCAPKVVKIGLFLTEIFKKK